MRNSKPTAAPRWIGSPPLHVPSPYRAVTLAALSAIFPSLSQVRSASTAERTSGTPVTHAVVEPQQILKAREVINDIYMDDKVKEYKDMAAWYRGVDAILARADDAKVQTQKELGQLSDRLNEQGHEAFLDAGLFPFDERRLADEIARAWSGFAESSASEAMPSRSQTGSAL